MRPFKNIKEQIRLLDSRGIRIDTYAKYKRAKQYLLTNNYYNLVNGYGRFFLINTNLYRDTTFDELTQLYEFDTVIRNSFFSATLTAEKHLRGVVAYYISERCSKSNKAEAYRDRDFYSKDIYYVRKKIWEIIDKNINSKNDNPIKNHYVKHGEVPFWVIVNYLTFSDLYKILKNVPNIQSKVARKMQSFLKEKFTLTTSYTEKELLSFMYNIYELRNVCAHGNRLLDFRCKRNVVYYQPLHSRYNIQRNEPRQSVYHIFIVLQCFLSNAEYAILHNTIRKRMNYLENKLSSISHNKILRLLGFPCNWNRNTPNLLQK